MKVKPWRVLQGQGWTGGEGPWNFLSFPRAGAEAEPAGEDGVRTWIRERALKEWERSFTLPLDADRTTSGLPMSGAC